MVEYLALPHRRNAQISRRGIPCVYATMTLFLSSSETLSNILSAGVVVSSVIGSIGSVAVAQRFRDLRNAWLFLRNGCLRE